MKIIDFDRKGNVVRFFLGDDDCEDYGGDDWNDAPYEINAGHVDSEYIRGYTDIAFPFNTLVLEPCDGHLNSCWCKDDMKKRRVPCIIAKPIITNEYYVEDFDTNVGDENVKKYYFGDKMEAEVLTNGE